VEVRSQQDQRPERRGENRGEDLRDGRQVGVVVVLGADEHAENHACEQREIAHPITFAARDRAPADPGVRWRAGIRGSAGAISAPMPVAGTARTPSPGRFRRERIQQYELSPRSHGAAQLRSV